MTQPQPTIKTGNFLQSATDKNGTGLLAYVHTLMEKMNEALPDASVTVIVANPIPGTPSGEVEVMSNIEPHVLPAALVQLGKDLGGVMAGTGPKPNEVN
jgi:hypothetical protein